MLDRVVARSIRQVSLPRVDEHHGARRQPRERNVVVTSDLAGHIALVRQPGAERRSRPPGDQLTQRRARVGARVGRNIGRQIDDAAERAPTRIDARPRDAERRVQTTELREVDAEFQADALKGPAGSRRERIQMMRRWNVTAIDVRKDLLRQQQPRVALRLALVRRVELSQIRKTIADRVEQPARSARQRRFATRPFLRCPEAEARGPRVARMRHVCPPAAASFIRT